MPAVTASPNVAEPREKPDRHDGHDDIDDGTCTAAITLGGLVFFLHLELLVGESASAMSVKGQRHYREADITCQAKNS